MAANTEESKLVRIGDQKLLVDGFLFQREDVTDYVLTHFHSDHTVGLSRRFAAGTIYCTDVTGALIVETFGVDPKRVRALPLGGSVEIPGPGPGGGVRLSFLSADHCPGSAVVFVEALDDSRLVLHTGDCRASESMRAGLQRWLADPARRGRRTVDELFLDTTYCNRRWTFPAYDIACEWLREIVRTEIRREPRTLVVMGAYQIGKERAARAVAEVLDSPVFVEHKRWKVLQLAGWGDVTLPSGKPLWSVDKDGCSVWLSPLGGLGHDVLQHFLKSTKGAFDAVVAFRPTGWAWAPRKMAAEGSAGCRVWAENDGATRIYGVPYSEHSSYTELQALAEMLRPTRIIPTVNSETQAGKERMVSHFLGFVDLRVDRERMDHYIFGKSQADRNGAGESAIDVLAMSLSACGASCSSASSSAAARGHAELAASDACSQMSSTVVVDISREEEERGRPQRTPCRWGAGALRTSTPGLLVDLDAAEEHEGDDCVPCAAACSSSCGAARISSCGVEASPCEEELRSVDIAQQARLLQYYETLARAGSARAAALQKKARPKKGSKKKGGQLAGGKGAGCGSAAEGSLGRLMGIVAVDTRKAAKGRRARKAIGAAVPAKRPRRPPDETSKAEGKLCDPKGAGERRPTRFVPKPSARVQERIERAFAHRLYLLSARAEGAGACFDVLGSTGNVYGVKLLPSGSECSCLDFAKASGVCKHVLFVMLRVLKLPREDHRVWQTSLVPSELGPLVEQVRGGLAAAGVVADDTVMRGYRAAQGEGAPKAPRRPLPDDCPICFEEMRESAPEALAFCGVCGHGVHCDCWRRWAAVSRGGEVCPLCRSPFGEGAGEGPLNLAAFSAEHRETSLAELYPETHRWIARAGRT